MTNEKKAEELGNRYGIKYEDDSFNVVANSREECTMSALAMADWKDEQFSNYLKARILRYAGSSAGQDCTLLCELNEIHQEFFGELAYNTIPNYNIPNFEHEPEH